MERGAGGGAGERTPSTAHRGAPERRRADQRRTPEFGAGLSRLARARLRGFVDPCVPIGGVELGVRRVHGLHAGR